MSRPPALPDETDVLVVGGGIMGASTAYFLARDSDRSVTLVEKDSIAAGSTGDSSAILRHHYGDQEIYTKMAWWSHEEFYRDFEAKTGEPISYTESPFVRFGDRETVSGDYATAGYETLSALDIPVSWIDGEDLPEQFPMFQGIESFDFAVSDDEAAYSDGPDVASGFARAAADQGATIVTDVEVTGIETANGSVAGAKTSEGTIGCEEIVIAAGPWTPRLAADVDVDIPVTPTREQILILEPPADFVSTYPSLVPTTGMPGGEWYLRSDYGDGILVATHYHNEEVDPDTFDRKPDEETILELVDVLSERIPELQDAEIRGQYCGVYSVTPDHDFILDQVGPAGVFVAAGFSGHGFKHGPAVGKILSDLVVRGTTDLVDHEFFSLDRFESDPMGHGPPDDSL